MAFRLLDIHYSSPAGWVFYITIPVLAALVLYVARRDSRLAPGFLHRLRTSAFATILAAGIYGAFVFAYNAFVDDSLIIDVLSDAQRRASAAGSSPEEIAATMDAVRAQAGTPARFAASVFVRLSVLGAIVAAISAVLVRPRSTSG